MLLHVLNRSPASSLVYRDVLRAMSVEDRLLLIEDGVYGALQPQAEQFVSISGRLFVLREDLQSRGLEQRCSAGITPVDMDGFVQLTEETERTVSWF